MPRILRSTLPAEMNALVLGFEYSFIVRDLLESVIGRTLKLESLVDSKTLFDIISKNGATSESRLQIDVLSLRQSHYNGDLNKIGWIPRSFNMADSLTKWILTKTASYSTWLPQSCLAHRYKDGQTRKKTTPENTRPSRSPTMQNRKPLECLCSIIGQIFCVRWS